MKKALLTILCVIVVAVGFINFISFVAESQRLGGDALNGYQANGHYYVSEHGESREVDAATWYSSRRHAISVFITHPLAMAAMAYLLIAVFFPASIFKGNAQAVSESEIAVRSSGAPGVPITCPDSIGLLHLQGPLMRAILYPGGLWVKPLLMPAFGIRSHEIVSVGEARQVFAKGLEISHVSPIVRSPIVLFCGPTASEFGPALQSVAAGTRKA